MSMLISVVWYDLPHPLLLSHIKVGFVLHDHDQLITNEVKTVSLFLYGFDFLYGVLVERRDASQQLLLIGMKKPNLKS